MSAPTANFLIAIDPATTQHYRDRLFDREGNPFAGDDILMTFVALRDRLVTAGFPVHTTDTIPDRSDGRRRILISLGVPDRLVSMTLRRYRTLARRDDVVLSAFIGIKCPVVEPTIDRAFPEFSSLFRRVLSWSDSDALLPFTG